jgi:hypothetical protein
MRRLFAIAVYAVAAAVALATCTREDGTPDPPVQQLVPCHPDAGAGDPLACPPRDGGVDAPP